MKCKIDVLENDIVSLKIKSESLLNEASKFTTKRKTLDVKKYIIENVHKKVIPYENGLVRVENNDKYEFVIKKVENGKWIPKIKNDWIPRTNTFGLKIMWVPKSLFVLSGIGV